MTADSPAYCVGTGPMGKPCRMVRDHPVHRPPADPPRPGPPDPPWHEFSAIRAEAQPDSQAEREAAVDAALQDSRRRVMIKNLDVRELMGAELVADFEEAARAAGRADRIKELEGALRGLHDVVLLRRIFGEGVGDDEMGAQLDEVSALIPPPVEGPEASEGDERGS